VYQLFGQCQRPDSKLIEIIDTMFTFKTFKIFIISQEQAANN